MEPSLRPAAKPDALTVAAVLVESRRTYLPFAPSAHTPEDVRTWVAETLLPSGGVYVAEFAGKVVAVLATSEGENCSWIDQLYVLPGYTGRKLGTRLLLYAHKTLKPPIRLYTFQANSGSRRFYERHGYQVVEFTDGSANEERCPDVLYEAAAPRAEA